MARQEHIEFLTPEEREAQDARDPLRRTRDLLLSIGAATAEELDALDREESCGGHFREEYQTDEGEALRDDNAYAYGAAWEFNGVGKDPTLHKEELVFENVPLTQRSYK